MSALKLLVACNRRCAVLFVHRAMGQCSEYNVWIMWKWELSNWNRCVLCDQTDCSVQGWAIGFHRNQHHRIEHNERFIYTSRPITIKYYGSAKGNISHISATTQIGYTRQCAAHQQRWLRWSEKSTISNIEQSAGVHLEPRIHACNEFIKSYALAKSHQSHRR